MFFKSSQETEANPHLVELHQFTHNFFQSFGAAVMPLDNKKHGPLQVQLSPELADHFNAPAITLCFQQTNSANGHELVAYGSRIFDRMVAFLEQRGAVSLQRLPLRFAGGEELLRAVRPTNAGITGLRMQEQAQLLFVFNWRITYRADDKHEEIYTVLLDEHGVRFPLNESEEDVTSAPNLQTMLADAGPLPPDTNEDGQPTAPKLPPMTQLTRLAETARKYIIYHADQRCVAYEAEILPRLYKTLNRLTTYYQQQIEETADAHDTSGEKRRTLEEDLTRKIQEEVENHRLRVQVQLMSYVILQIPVATAAITLSDGKREATIQVQRNRYTGVLTRPTCHACAKETGQLALDRNGHITCDACIRQCGSCQDLLCAQCGVAACPVCKQENCDACGHACQACGERACADHLSRCPICGDDVCFACQAECAACGQRQCRSHLRLDHVRLRHGETIFVCADCSIRCPGCAQYSAQVDLCSVSGQRFCRACLGVCSTCNRQVNPSYYRVIDGATYCLDCMIECAVCHSWTLGTKPCSHCNEPCCHACGHTCSVCRQLFCTSHSHPQATCNHAVCDAHRAQCGVCKLDVCPTCTAVCGICERHFCQDHTATCKRCGCTYCRECVRLTGVCDTCAMIPRDGTPVKIEDEPCFADPAVAALAPNYRWARLSNQRYTLYLGQNALMFSALVVVEKTGNEQRVISARKIGMIETIRGKLWG